MKNNRPGSGRNSKENGFTMTELLGVLVVVAIVATIAFPVLMRSVPNYRLRSVARNLVAHFQKAKLEAVKRGVKVWIVFAPQAYEPAGRRGSYTICADDSKNDACDAGEVLFQEQMPKFVSLYPKDDVQEGVTQGGVTFAGNEAGYKPNGLPFALGSVEIRNNRGRFYKVSLSAAGHAKLTSKQGAANPWP